jgi:hypothetical protein
VIGPTGAVRVIIDAACEAWRNLFANPSTITSIGHRERPTPV